MASSNGVESSAAHEVGGEQFYDQMWDRYAHLDAGSPAAFHRRRLIVRLAERHARAPARLLDVGCGQGQLLRDLAARFPGVRAAGSDVSRASVELARRSNPGLEVFQMDLTSADFDASHGPQRGAFQLVTCSEVIEHIADDALAARRLAALLAPGGTLVVSVPGGKMSRFDRLIGHHRHYDRARLDALLAGAGLEVLEVVAWGFPFQNLYRSAVRLVSRLSMPEPGAPEPKAEHASGVSRLLGAGYEWFGRALKPLFYLNRPYWGEQLLAAARRTHAS